MKRPIPTPKDVGDGRREVAAMLPPPPSKAKRNREWERAQRAGEFVQITYRRIPRAVRDQITETAKAQRVTTDEVARAFLEYALRAYQAGDLELSPSLRTGRFTLFPENGE